jgi:squalene cyclase
MKPTKFVAHQERRLGRLLNTVEASAVARARDECTTGKRDTTKAMWEALNAVLHAPDLSERNDKAAA